MRITAFLTAAAAGVLITGAAYAQTEPAPQATSDGTMLDQVNETGRPETTITTKRTTVVTTTTTPAAAPLPEPAIADPAMATPAASAGSDVSATEPAAPTVRLVSNPPVPDTAENRAKYGGPDSRGGRKTSARGN